MTLASSDPPSSDPRRRPLAWPRLLTYALGAGVLCYAAVLLGSGAAPDERVRLLRYWALFGAAVFAVGVPHVLFPDAERALHQLLNRSPRALLGRHLRRGAQTGALLLAPGLLLAFYDPTGFGQDLAAKSLHLLEAGLIAGGAGLYSLTYYGTLGRRSQRWQEGGASAWYRSLQEHSTTGGAGVPTGLVPAITASGWIFGAAALVLGLGAYAGALAPALALAPGLLFVGWAAWRLRRAGRRYDRHFYQTNAFYDEVFRRGGVGIGERAPVAYDAVYWAPHRRRPAVWASLRQMDRRLPLGRLVALGHVGLWLLLLQDAAPRSLGTYLLLFAAAKNGACYLLGTPALAPMDFQRARQSAAGWFVTRLLVNLRWMLPWLLSLLAAAWLTGALSYVEALAWTGADVGMAALAAALVTCFGEVQHRRQYA